MPQIFDNIDLKLFHGLRAVLPAAQSSSFCVGYLNLRGWGELADLVEGLPGGDETSACRLLVWMHRPPEDEMKTLQSVHRQALAVDGPSLARLRELFERAHDSNATLRAMLFDLRSLDVVRIIEGTENPPF